MARRVRIHAPTHGFGTQFADHQPTPHVMGESVASGRPVRKSNSAGLANAVESRIESHAACGLSALTDPCRFVARGLSGALACSRMCPRRPLKQKTTKPWLASRSKATVTVVRETSREREKAWLARRQSPERSRRSTIAGRTGARSPRSDLCDRSG
jgi:hypothetical protein